MKCSNDFFLIPERPLNTIFCFLVVLSFKSRYVLSRKITNGWRELEACLSCDTLLFWVFSSLCSERDIHLWLLVMYQGRCWGLGPCGVCGEGHVPERLGVSGSGSCRGVIPLTWAPLARVLLIYWAVVFQPLPPPNTPPKTMWSASDSVLRPNDWTVFQQHYYGRLEVLLNVFMSSITDNY